MLEKHQIYATLKMALNGQNEQTESKRHIRKNNIKTLTYEHNKLTQIASLFKTLIGSKAILGKGQKMIQKRQLHTTSAYLSFPIKTFLQLVLKFVQKVGFLCQQLNGPCIFDYFNGQLK